MSIKSKTVWKVSSSVLGLIVLLAILFAGNILVSNVRLRIDLTQNKLYTLSEGTRKLLKKLEQPVTLKLFFSASTPEVPVYLKNYAQQVEDLLKEYKLAGGHILIEKYDPQPDSDAEEWAQRYGLASQALGLFGPPVYFGIVAVAGNTEACLPFLDPRAENLLEYNITRLIYRVTHPDKPTVGLISSLPVMGSEPPPFAGGPRAQRQQAWRVFKDLKEDYNIRELASDVAEIPKDISVLLLIHPKELADKTLYAIDQFVLRGGHLLAFLDPLSVADLEGSPVEGFGRTEASSDLHKLLTAWGITYDPGKVVADMRAVTRLRGANNAIEENAAFLTLGSDHISRDDVVTAQLSTLMMPFAGSFSWSGSGELTVTPLIRSSIMAGNVGTITAQFGGNAILREFKPEPLPLNLAVRLAGKFKTAFPEGKPKSESEHKEDDKSTDASAEKTVDAGGLTEGESVVVLVGDLDMLYDRFCVEELNFLGFIAHRPLNDNYSFFANVLEQLAGSSDLIAIRSRGSFARPFDRVLALEEKARREWQAREEDLLNKLQETRRQLSQLEAQKTEGQRFILSKEQKEAIARFRQEEQRINRELKEVRKNLRGDIERLGARVKFVNIALMPILVSCYGVAFGIYRKRKR